MSRHAFDNEFSVTHEQKERFRRDGFVKLEGFLNAKVVNTLLDRVEVEMAREDRGNLQTSSIFARSKYDFEAAKSDVYELLERPYFRTALTELVEHDLFLAFEMCFELEKNVSKGFPWHVGVQSFSYQAAEEKAYTLWVPLHPVDAKGQRGGMAYVPENVVSGEFAYRLDPLVASTMEAKERAGTRTSANEYAALRVGILNSPSMAEILESHQVEDDFEPGDALLFNKYVIHRSIMLGEGPLARRAAYVMRFVDAASRYDLKQARSVEFPERQYGHGMFPYRPFTRQHMEIAEAGARDGDLLAECVYFDNRDRRTVRRESAS